ncbi:MAG: YkgJ family cysteine cluster protein [Myxococcota bacterium]
MTEHEGHRETRRCGPCSLCCTVLRVDELGKLAGTPCSQLRSEGGCGIHASRPGICRAYRCAWLEGRFRDADRPDRLGALVDFAPRGADLELVIVEAHAGAFEGSLRLREIAADHRENLVVRVSDTLDAEDPDRPYRLLMAGGVEHRVRGERVSILREGLPISEMRLPWLERQVRRLLVAWRRWRLSRARDRAGG